MYNLVVSGVFIYLWEFTKKKTLELLRHYCYILIYLAALMFILI